MNYWIFIVTGHRVDGETLTADEIFEQRMKDKFWGLGEKTPNRNSLQKGDQIVYYVGLPRKTFAASAVLSTSSFSLSKEQRSKFAHGKQFYQTEYGVLLENIQIWDNPRRVENLVSDLKFIENKEFWFAYFQGGVRQISEQDFRTITEGREGGTLRKAPTVEDIKSESEFALETHLEEFIDKNWERIGFNSRLERYKTEDQSGRQFPAGQWSIDFLCIDKDTGELVIVELKRGKSSDSTVGQVLRYIGWVKENLAKPEQDVRGIIIAKEVDEALQYTLKNLNNVSVLTYKIDFKLSRF